MKLEALIRLLRRSGVVRYKAADGLELEFSGLPPELLGDIAGAKADAKGKKGRKVETKEKSIYEEDDLYPDGEAPAFDEAH